MNELFPITVVIPTYNRIDVLGRCIGSVFKQSVSPDSVIVVDDGSSDGSFEWLHKNYPTVRCVRQDNLGVSATRNLGIRDSTTEWIAFLDSDDCWLPNKLEKQMKALSENPGYKICHTEEKWIYKDKKRPVSKNYRKKNGWIFEDCLPVCAISPSTAMIHNSVFDEVGLFDETLPVCEDYDLWLRICSRMPVLLVDEPLIEKHGGRDDQLSAQWGLDKYRIRALEKILDEDHLSEKDRELARAQLVQKCQIYAAGLERHGKLDEAKYYRSLAE